MKNVGSCNAMPGNITTTGIFSQPAYHRAWQDGPMQTFASYDGTRLAYHEKGSGAPLVCVPGGPGRASAYLGDLGGLSAHRTLVLLDNRGTGDSAVPDDPKTYRCERLVEDVEALRAHLGLERVDLLAHSAGGNIAVLYAARHPERVERLVLVCPSWRATDLEIDEDEWMARIRRRKDEQWSPEAYAALMAWDAGDGGSETRLRAAPLFYGPWTEEAAANAAADQAQRSPAAADGFGVDGAFGDPAQTRAALAALTAPALLIGGELDPAPPERLLREYAAMFPAGRLVVRPGAGHSPWIDDPAAFVATVAGFLG
jgi:proline iminopeptidase